MSYEKTAYAIYVKKKTLKINKLIYLLRRWLSIVLMFTGFLLVSSNVYASGTILSDNNREDSVDLIKLFDRAQYEDFAKQKALDGFSIPVASDYSYGEGA